MSAGLGVVWGTGLILPIALAPRSTTLALPFDPPSLRFLPAPRLTGISESQWLRPVALGHILTLA